MSKSIDTAKIRELERQLEQKNRETDWLRSKVPEQAPEPMYFDKLFHSMDRTPAKNNLINHCKVELSKAFAMLPKNKKEKSAAQYYSAMSALWDKAEEFIKIETGKRWRLREVGDFAVKSNHFSKMMEDDFIRLTFAYPALKAGPNPNNQLESPTGTTPTLAFMTFTIKNFEAVDRR